MTDADFITEIHANEHDDTPRLVYADWLEDKGDPRAEYLRLECELASLNPDDALWQEQYPRLLQLREKMPETWLADVGRAVVANCEEVRCPRLFKSLRATHTPRIRMCDVCARPVQYYAQLPEAAAQSEANMVAIDKASLPHEFRQAIDRFRRITGRSAREPRVLERREPS